VVSGGKEQASRVVVCLPTYNERENLERMVHALDPFNVLVIDDGSPDGTGEIADRLATELDRVEVLHRAKKEGLGAAYVAGFCHALEAGADLVVTIDCDFSHDPADVPRLVAAAADADLVLGSRYVHGGSVANWGVVRRAISRGGSLYARTVLGIRVRDVTGGFKVYRRSLLEAIDLDSIEAKGYAFQVETTYRALRCGFRVTEVPIRFVDRVAGASKMTSGIVAEAMWKVPQLRFGPQQGADQPSLAAPTAQRRIGQGWFDGDYDAVAGSDTGTVA
jgi:dolichol-phosphate mannosyltransferase